MAARLAPLVRRGDVIVLSGDLGAGKTAFTKGLCEALGVQEPVTSPTFTLMRTYSTDRGFPVHHLDVYRLDRLAELDDLGVTELIDDGVTVIEWGEAVTARLGNDYLHIHIGFGNGDDDRELEVALNGSRWTARYAAIVRALEC